MWRYSQSTGVLSRDGIEVATGYSGAASGKNNPAMEAVPNVGPIPRGRWQIGAAHDSTSHGPLTMPLFACSETHGRAGFLIHADSKSHPGQASRGCIVLQHAIREMLADSEDRELEVVD